MTADIVFQMDGDAFSKTGKPAVPAFLQKLYEIVNDSNHNDVVNWSTTGDSFVVTDPDRFSKEILGRWFKHQKFSSFVRQLNMYGFHKISGLQQGSLVAQNASDPHESCCRFRHPAFLRGRPDELKSIQRKRQSTSGGGGGGGGGNEQAAMRQSHSAITPSDRHATPAPSQLPPPDARPVTARDLSTSLTSLTTHLDHVRTHQSSLHSELSALHASTAGLWQEVRAGREENRRLERSVECVFGVLLRLVEGGGEGRGKRRRVMLLEGGEGQGVMGSDEMWSPGCESTTTDQSETEIASPAEIMPTIENEHGTPSELESLPLPPLSLNATSAPHTTSEVDDATQWPTVPRPLKRDFSSMSEDELDVNDNDDGQRRVINDCWRAIFQSEELVPAPDAGNLSLNFDYNDLNSNSDYGYDWNNFNSSGLPSNLDFDFDATSPATPVDEPEREQQQQQQQVCQDRGECFSSAFPWPSFA